MSQENRSHLPPIIFACFVVLAGAATFLYPDDWNLPLPIAALFGPFLGVRMQLEGSFPFLLAFLILMVPITKWQNVFTGILLLVGLGLWLYSGYACGLWLGA